MKKSTTVLLMFAYALLHSQSIFAQNVMESVLISYYDTGGICIKKEHKPNRAPANVPIKACVSYAEKTLYVSSSSDASLEYYVYGINIDTPLTSGICNFHSPAWETISLESLPNGSYTIFFVINGTTYKGDIEI